MSTPFHVYQSIAQATHEHGVETMFGLMGDANLFMVDSFVRDCGGRFVPAAHEGSSILMARAYAHVSGKGGVATVTHGPALTNCATALTEAARAICKAPISASWSRPPGRGLSSCVRLIPWARTWPAPFTARRWSGGRLC